MLTMEHRIEFYCDTCRCQEPMNAVDAINHLKLVHGIKNLTGTRVLLFTAEGDIYQNTYELRIGEVTLTQINSGPRTEGLGHE